MDIIGVLSPTPVLREIHRKDNRDRISEWETGMDGAPYTSRYWRRKKGWYERLNGSNTQRGRHRLPVATLGSGSAQKKCLSWKIKIKRRLRFFKCLKSPRQFFTSLKDGYVKMMLSFSHSRVFADGYGCEGGPLGYGYRQAPAKEYDEKVMVEMYKSMVLQEKLVVLNSLKAAQAIASKRGAPARCSNLKPSSFQ